MVVREGDIVEIDESLARLHYRDGRTTHTVKKVLGKGVIRLTDRCEIAPRCDFVVDPSRYSLKEEPKFKLWDRRFDGEDLDVDVSTTYLERSALNEAAKVLKERGEVYDNDDHTTLKMTRDLWNAFQNRGVYPPCDYGDEDLETWDICVMMALHKIARICADPSKDDSWVDAAGHIELGFQTR